MPGIMMMTAISQQRADGPKEGLCNQQISFSGYSYHGTPSFRYHWDFGDDNTSQLQNPFHIYAKPGNYTVILTITDRYYTSHFDSFNITISVKFLNMLVETSSE